VILPQRCALTRLVWMFRFLIAEMNDLKVVHE